MDLSELELDILKSIDHLPADCGEAVSPASLSRSLPDRSDSEIRETLHGLRDKQLLRLDEHDCAMVREEGAAALKGM